MPIRTAIVGYGTAGSVFHAPFIESDPRYNTKLVVARSPSNVARARQTHKNVQVVPNVEEMLRHSAELDLVIVASPPDTHAEIAHRVLDKGLSVVVDKPLCATRKDVADLIDHAQSVNALLTVFQNRRWDGDFMTVKKLVNGAALGRLYRLESRFEWWKPTETKPWKRETPAKNGGGILFDLGSHLIDQAIQLFGPVSSACGEVRCWREGASDDDAFVSLEHVSGVSSRLYMSSIAAQVGPRFRLLGSRGAYVKWGLDPQEGTLAAGGSPHSSDFGLEAENAWGNSGIDGRATLVPTTRGDYGAFYDLLADAILGDGAPPVDPTELLDVISIIESIHSWRPYRAGTGSVGEPCSTERLEHPRRQSE